MRRLTRREALKLLPAAGSSIFFIPQISCARNHAVFASAGAIAGEALSARTGQKILDDGGNAVDAAIAAAFVACVVSPHNCGIGGYGGHMILRLGRKMNVRAIDFNTAAPEDAHATMYPQDSQGKVIDRRNEHGWLAVGVPGTLAGLELAAKKYGTRTLRELLQPAIAYAHSGYPASAGLASAIRNSRPFLEADPELKSMFLESGPVSAGQTLSNVPLAKVLQQFAEENSLKSFYRGDIATRMAEVAQRHGGLLKLSDLARYQARDVPPLSIRLGKFTIFTPPLTSGGISVLQGLLVLKEMGWPSLPLGIQPLHAELETLRRVWRDRLSLLGEANESAAPEILSDTYAAQIAHEVLATVQKKEKLGYAQPESNHQGTIHLSAADRWGGLVALTLTHGNAFGARVAVPGLGIILGHGMSRFNPAPGHPNSVAPFKRPLHNMCPTIVYARGGPVLAIGGAGGRKIPNSVFSVLKNYCLENRPVRDALAAARLQTEGANQVILEKHWPQADTDYLTRLGYKVESGSGALINLVALDPESGGWIAGQR